MFDHLRAVALNLSQTKKLITTVLDSLKELGMENLTWFKSSYSSGNGQCVECARGPDGGMAVRDSRHPAAGVLSSPPRPGASSWSGFTDWLPPPASSRPGLTLDVATCDSVHAEGMHGLRPRYARTCDPTSGGTEWPSSHRARRGLR
jgi:hypothetical protein